MRRPAIRYRPRPYPDHLIRTVERGGEPLELRIQRQGHAWGELVDISGQTKWVASPGARSITIAEYVGPDVQRIRRHGEWVEISAEVARSNADIQSWCRRHANSEMPSGAFLLPPADWKRHLEDKLCLPFLPEFDHPDDELRQLATVEASRRKLELQLQRATDLRRQAIVTATSAGHSRRSLGDLIGLSYARIQQLVAGD